MKILATSWHPGGVNAIVPVIKALIDVRGMDVVTIGYQFSRAIFEKNNISFKKISHYGLTNVSVKSMEALLQTERPDLVLTGTSTQSEENKDVIEQTITLAAKHLRIKSLAVLDFWANYAKRFSDKFTQENFKYLPDQIAIMDGIAREAMLKEGFDSKGLTITGNPFFDDLSAKAENFDEDQKRSLRETIGLNPECLIFYAGNAFGYEGIDVGFSDLDNIEIIAEAIRGLPLNDFDVVIKLHPRTPADDHMKIVLYIDKHPKMKLITDIDSQQIALASDLTVVAYSTIGIEMVYMGKPCISFQPGLKGDDQLIISERGFIPVGYTAEDCLRELEEAMFSEDHREAMLKQASGFKTDGKATERVMALIHKMLDVLKQ